MHSPMIVVNAGLMEEERTISGLFPVALIASPSRVRRNSDRNRTTNVTALSPTSILYCGSKAVPFSVAFIQVKIVVVLFIFKREDLFITAMLIE